MDDQITMLKVDQQVLAPASGAGNGASGQPFGQLCRERPAQTGAAQDHIMNPSPFQMGGNALAGNFNFR